MSANSLRQQLRETATELQQRLTAAGDEGQAGKDEFAGLSWDDAMRARAETARFNGGAAAEPRPRHGITGWAEQTNQTHWDFDRMRFISLTPLAAAWINTGEPDYAQAARDYIEGWMESHPNPDDDSRLNTAIRINLHGPQGWLGTLPYFLDSPAYDDEFLAGMIEVVRRDLEWMRQEPAHTANVRLFQADSLLWAGLRLPFLDKAETWRRLGARMLNEAFHRMFAADGSNVEKDPHYVGVYTSIYGDMPRWRQAFPELNLQVELEPVARMFDYALCGTKPNGYEVGLHDSVSAWEGRRDNPARKARDNFRKRMSLPDTMPPTSAFFPDAGQVFMRTGWDESDAMMSFDATREASAHNHLGANSIQLHAHGRTLLMDPGFLTYHMGHLKGSERDNIAGPHGKSTRAHNTLNLNGWNQWMISPETTRHWHADGVDAVVSRYAGGYWPGRYGWWFFEGGGHGLAATHERVLFWLHGRAAIVIDFMTRWDESTHGDDQHQTPSLEANWQLCPGPVTIDAANREVVTGHDDANLLMLFPVLPDNAELALHEGETEPFRGWVGSLARDHSYRPAPQLSVTADPMADYQQHMITVLAPYAGRDKPEVTVTTTPDGGPGAVTPGHLTLEWGNGTSDSIWWIHALDGPIMNAADFETDARLVHLQHSAKGALTQAAMVHGTYCTPHFANEYPKPTTVSWNQPLQH